MQKLGIAAIIISIGLASCGGSHLAPPAYQIVVGASHGLTNDGPNNWYGPPGLYDIRCISGTVTCPVSVYPKGATAPLSWTTGAMALEPGDYRLEAKPPTGTLWGYLRVNAVITGGLMVRVIPTDSQGIAYPRDPDGAYEIPIGDTFTLVVCWYDQAGNPASPPGYQFVSGYEVMENEKNIPPMGGFSLHAAMPGYSSCWVYGRKTWTSPVLWANVCKVHLRLVSP